MQTLGICTWTLGISDIQALMAKIKSLGLNGVQYCEPMDAHSATEVKAAAEQHGLEIILYDPFDCRPNAHNGAATMENAIAYYQRAIEYAAELNCGQTIQGLGAWTENCTDEDEAWQFLISSVQTLSAYAKDKGVPLSYEPCNRYEVPYIHTAREYQKLVCDSGCDDLAVLLDSFHMNIEEKNPVEVLEKYASKNSVFHISGANREGIPGGHIDFKAHYTALQAGGFTGPCVIECVLSTNPVNTPPRNPEEMERLSQIITQTWQTWQSYSL